MEEFDTSTTEHDAAGSITPVPIVPRDSARLIVVAGADTGRRVTFSALATIGREPGSTLLLRDTNVSRRHASVTKHPDERFTLEDLGSRNGTLLNGEKVERARLEFGDRLQVGSSLVLFTFVDANEDMIAQREKLETIGRLGAGIAHDMNNFLGVALSNGELAREITRGSSVSGQDLADLRECLDDIVGAAQRGADLTRGLLGFVRRGPPESQRVDLSSIVSDAAALTRRVFPPAVSVARAIVGDLHVMGDKSQLHQVVMNLLINARDAMPAGGRVVVRLGRQEATADAPAGAVLVVEDTGQGMDAATRARIFEPFFTTKPAGIGTGLGLAAVSDVVRGHGGRIECDSVLGAGARFTITLPLASEPTGARKTRRSSQRFVAAARSMTIVVAESDVALRRGTARALRRAGHKVLEVPDGSGCVQLCAREGLRFDALVLEVGSGTAEADELVVSRVRAAAPTTRIVALTGAWDAVRAARLEQLGLLTVLAKPCGFDDLLTAILPTPPDAGPR